MLVTGLSLLVVRAFAPELYRVPACGSGALTLPQAGELSIDRADHCRAFPASELVFSGAPSRDRTYDLRIKSP